MKFNRRILFVIFFAILGAFAYRYTQSWEVNYYDRIIDRMDQIEDDGGSGRTSLANKSVELFLNMNFIQMLIGKGYSAIDSERYLSGYNSFHNDYSEAAYSYGIIGLILFVSMIVCVFKNVLYSRKYKSRYRFAIVSSFIILIVFSFTSSVMHYTFYMLPLFIFWGYVEPRLKI